MVHDTISVCQGTHFNQCQFSGPNWSHMRDLAAEPGPNFMIFRRASYLQIWPKVGIQWYMQYQGFSGYSFWKILLSKYAGARPHGPRPWPRPILGPGQAHISMIFFRSFPLISVNFRWIARISDKFRYLLNLAKINDCKTALVVH